MSARSHSKLTIAAVIALYCTVSISMVFANKYLLGGRHSQHDVSLFVAWIQCVMCVFLAVAANWFRRRFLGQDESLPPISMKLFSNRDVIVLCSVFTCMLTFNNLCLKNVGVAFFQVARSMTLLFTVVLSGVILRKFASWRIWCCCLGVVAGFMLGVDQESIAGTLSIRGVFYGVTTSMCVALNSIFTKRVMERVKGNPVSVVFYMNVGSSLFFIPLLVATGQLQTGLGELVRPAYLLLLLLSGFLGFFVGIASNLSIDITSPTSHNITNNTKSVMQTVIAVMASGEAKAVLWWCSNFMVIGGAFSYTMIRMKEDEAEKAEKAAATAAAGPAAPKPVAVEVEASPAKSDSSPKVPV